MTLKQPPLQGGRQIHQQEWPATPIFAELNNLSIPRSFRGHLSNLMVLKRSRLGDIFSEGTKV